ncbi:hypothetical protein EGW08_017736, partial [Elysia chlorotica]
IGFYPVCLEDYLKLFPRQNFLFIKFEDYTEGREKILNKVLKFLDMGPSTESMKEIVKSKTVANAGHFEPVPMLNETRLALRHFFSPFVRDLKRIVGADFVQSWGY